MRHYSHQYTDTENVKKKKNRDTEMYERLYL